MINVGDEVTAEWTHGGHHYRAKGVVAKVNERTVKVRITEDAGDHFKPGFVVTTQVYKVHKVVRMNKIARSNKPIPYDEDDAPESDERDMRKIYISDEEALELMQGWTGGQDDPLYAISSTGGWNYAWVFTDAIANIDRDLSRVKKIGRDKYQLGKGTFSKKEIDELEYIRDELQMALDDPESELVDEVRETRVVADFNTLDDLIAHARDELGASHVVVAGPESKLYFPRGGTHAYEAASVRRKGGYWHADGPGSREGVRSLPAAAQPIGGGRVGRRAAEHVEASGGRGDYSLRQSPDHAQMYDAYFERTRIGSVRGPFGNRDGSRTFYDWTLNGPRGQATGRARTQTAAFNQLIRKHKEWRAIGADVPQVGNGRGTTRASETSRSAHHHPTKRRPSRRR